MTEVLVVGCHLFIHKTLASIITVIKPGRSISSTETNFESFTSSISSTVLKVEHIVETFEIWACYRSYLDRHGFK